MSDLTPPVEAFENTVPASWALIPSHEDEDVLKGYNLVSGETFEGTRAEFNKRLRGK